MTRTLLLLMLGFSLSGCALRNWMFPPAPFSDRSPCAIAPNVTKDQLVAHLNKNIQGSATSSGLASWRCLSAKITATGMPPGISVPASLAVEAPRSFRLRVSEPLTRVEALDMGSNPERFWFWAKDAQPQQVMTVSHDDMPSIQRELQVPFHPDWLMEVFGVIPIDASRYTLKRGRADAPTLELVSKILTPAGDAKTKVIRIDACHGIIREYALYDGRDIVIARAALADHRVDQTTGIVVPRVVNFDWPAMQQTMKIVLNNIELNPPTMPAAVWQVPSKPGSPQMDLSQSLGSGDQDRGLYGAGSPFGIVPPADSGPMNFQSQHPVSQTTYEEDIVWDNERSTQQADASVPEQPAHEHRTHPDIKPSADGQPSAYSPAASQSSSDPPRRERALWNWPDR